MADPVALLLAGQQAFSARVAAIGAHQWDAPTPDSEWSVADLVDHLIDEQRWVAPLMRGDSLEDAGRAVEALGPAAADRKAAWEEATTAAAAACRADGALEGSVQLSRGPTPALDYLHEMIFDLCVHSWDLGKAIGADHPLPEDLVAATYAAAKAFGDLAGTGYFSAAVPVPDDAPQLDKLVALTGRDPHWSPPSGG